MSKRKLTTAARKYHFELPYKMTAVNVFWGVGLLKAEGAFSKLPQDIQEKMEKAKAEWHPLKVSEADLNRIDDATWASIAKKLKLSYDN